MRVQSCAWPTVVATPWQRLETFHQVWARMGCESQRTLKAEGAFLLVDLTDNGSFRARKTSTGFAFGLEMSWKTRAG